MDNILNITDVRKSFNAKKALNGVSFDVKRGSICGILGPNGAGKTTILRIINSILLPDYGSVKINGNDVSLATSKYMGYLPEERGLYDRMKIEDQILYFGRLKGGNPQRLREVMDEYLELFEIKEEKKRRIKELSKGNQQKVQIISTIVHEPELVILDEPFSGFDPINGVILQELIGRLKAKGTTILLSSHNMNAIEEICDDIVLINQGNLLLNDSISNIKETHKEDNFIITTASELNEQMFKDAGIVKIINSIPAHNKRKGFSYRLKRNENVSNFDLIDFTSYQSEILHFEEELPSLKDIFIKLTSHVQS